MRQVRDYKAPLAPAQLQVSLMADSDGETQLPFYGEVHNPTISSSILICEIYMIIHANISHIFPQPATAALVDYC
jgi:hypothetical protein